MEKNEMVKLSSPKSLTKSEIEEASKNILHNLLSEHNAITSYVMLKQLETAVEQALEVLRLPAIVDHSNNSVLGAEVKVVYKKVYKYNSSHLSELIDESKVLAETIKKKKKMLELVGTAGVVNPENGEIETAEVDTNLGYLTVKFQ